MNCDGEKRRKKPLCVHHFMLNHRNYCNWLKFNRNCDLTYVYTEHRGNRLLKECVYMCSGAASTSLFGFSLLCVCVWNKLQVRRFFSLIKSQTRSICKWLKKNNNSSSRSSSKQTSKPAASPQVRTEKKHIEIDTYDRVVHAHNFNYY